MNITFIVLPIWFVLSTLTITMITMNLLYPTSFSFISITTISLYPLYFPALLISPMSSITIPQHFTILGYIFTAYS
jgi:hypothetical protein